MEFNARLNVLGKCPQITYSSQFLRLFDENLSDIQIHEKFSLMNDDYFFLSLKVQNSNSTNSYSSDQSIRQNY